jgi:excisionase family DNA binding protein
VIRGDNNTEEVSVGLRPTRELPPDTLLDVTGAAAFLGISVGTLYHWVSERRIPVIRFSKRCIRFRLCDVQKWISEKLVASH